MESQGFVMWNFDLLSFVLGGLLDASVVFIAEFVAENLFGDDETKK